MSDADHSLLRRNLEDAARDLVQALTRDGKEPLGNVVAITREEMWDLIRMQSAVRNFGEGARGRNVYEQRGRLHHEVNLDHEDVAAFLRIKPRHLNDTVVVNERPEDRAPVNVNIGVDGPVVDPDALADAIRRHFGGHPPWTCASPVRDERCEYEPWDPRDTDPPECVHCSTGFPGAQDSKCERCDGAGLVCSCCLQVECADDLVLPTFVACPHCTPDQMFRRMGLALT